MTWRRDRYVGCSRTARLVGAMLVLAAVAGCSDRAGDTRDNVVLVMVDTLRADHLGCYDYQRDTSPNLDRLATAGVLFENFYSVAPWTNPAIASLFTGRYPRAVFPPLPHKKAIGIPLPSQLPTLAERLQEAEHGNSFFNELTRVPMILVPPQRERVAGLRVKTPASLVDLKPTILGLAGLEPEKELEGRDLRTSWSNPADFEAPRWLFLASPHSQSVEAAAVVRGDLKYIDRLPWRQARPALFDLAEDPAEKHNLAGVSPQAAEMSRRLQAHLIQTEQLRSGLLKEDDVELDKEVLERLRALGYLQ